MADSFTGGIECAVHGGTGIIDEIDASATVPDDPVVPSSLIPTDFTLLAQPLSTYNSPPTMLAQPQVSATDNDMDMDSHDDIAPVSRDDSGPASRPNDNTSDNDVVTDDLNAFHFLMKNRNRLRDRPRRRKFFYGPDHTSKFNCKCAGCKSRVAARKDKRNAYIASLKRNHKRNHNRPLHSHLLPTPPLSSDDQPNDHDSDWQPPKSQKSKPKPKKKLFVSAKRVRVVQPSMKLQLEANNVPDTEYADYLKAYLWGPIVVKEYERNFGARCDWAVFKKEANGGVPVSTLEMKENDMDEHWNIYYVSKKKMGRIHAHQLDVRFIKGHLLPPNSMNTPDHTNSSQSQDFKRWLEYVFKFDSVNGMFDRNLFYMHGMVLGCIGTPKELKKWFETGAKLETKSTVVIISMIRKGWTNA
eukprot:389184_1